MRYLKEKNNLDIINICIFLIFAILLPTSFSNAQTIPNGKWVASSPGGGGWFRSIRINPTDKNKVYVTCDLGGFYRSEDGGHNWINSSTGLKNIALDAVVVHPDGNTLFLASNGGIYKSSNGGKNWARKGNNEIYPSPSYSRNYDNSFSISAIYAHPANSDYIFAGSGFSHNVKYQGPNPAKIYRSSNKGENWQEVSVGIPKNDGNSFSSFAGNPNDINIVYAGSRSGLFKSTNKGESWSKIRDGRIRWVSVDPNNKNIVYITIIWEDNGLYKSTDGGNSWTKIGNNLPKGKSGTVPRPEEVQFGPDNTTLYVGAGNTSPPIYKSTNGGNSWTVLSNIPPRGWFKYGSVATSFSFSSDASKVYYCNDFGVYGSDNGGQNFNHTYTSHKGDGYYSTNGIELNVVYQMLPHPTQRGKIYRITSDTGLQISLDGGKSWKWNSSAQKFNSCAHWAVFDPSNSDIMYMLIGGNTNSGIGEKLIKSFDAGETWQEVSNNLPKGRILKLEISKSGDVNNRTLYASVQVSSSNGVFRSTNNGKTWNKLLNIGWPSKVSIDPRNENILFVGNANAGALYKSSNKGSSWNKIEPDKMKDVKWIEFHPDNSDIIFVAQRGYSNRNSKIGGIWKSTDGGTSFRKTLVPLDNDPGYFVMVKFDPNNTNRLYAVARGEDTRYDTHTGQGVFISNDLGESWIQMNTSLTYLNVIGIDIDRKNSDIYISTMGGGSYKWESSALNIDDPQNNTGFKLFLEGPFNNGTMTTTLTIPNTHPYNDLPWNYSESQSISIDPSNIVDWILVELRSDLSEVAYKKVGLLNNQGLVLNTDGSSFSFSNINSSNYYITINHRNHIGIMSAQKVKINNDVTINYDFTDSQSKAYGSDGMVELSTGQFGLYAGDTDKDNIINNLDYGNVANFIFNTGYFLGDIDMNGVVNVLDYTNISKNMLVNSKIP